MIKKEVIPRIGKRIREIRLENNMKLYQLAEKSNISKGLLSKIENGRTIPSLPVCFELIRALDVDLNDFFCNINLQHLGSYQLIRKGEETPVSKEEASGFNYKKILGVDFSNYNLNIEILYLENEAERDFVSTDGFEYIHVITGNLDYHLDDKKLKLNEGDSLFFDGRIPHVPKNISGEKVKLLIIYLVN